jgi:hypothetical protein
MVIPVHTDGPLSTWIAVFLGSLIGITIASPRSWKFSAGVLLLLGLTWLIGGGLFGFDATEIAIGEALRVLFSVIFVALFVVVGIGFLIFLFSSIRPGIAITALLLWFGLSDFDEDE